MITDAETTLSEMAEETRKNRTIEELLALESYETMNDEEIELVTQYKIEWALKSADMQAKREAYLAESEANIKATQQLADETQKRYEDLLVNVLTRIPPIETDFTTNDKNSVTPVIVEWS